MTELTACQTFCNIMLFFVSVKGHCEAVGHIGILCVIRREGCKNANDREDECEDEGAGWQHVATCQPHQVGAHSLSVLEHVFLLLCRLNHDRGHIYLIVGTNTIFCWLFEHFVSGVQDNLEEGDCHGKEHPDVDHLDVGGHWQALRESLKTEHERMRMNEVTKTYMVAKTRRMVRLT